MATSTTDAEGAGDGLSRLLTESAEETMALGAMVGSGLRVGDCIGLMGGLGAGKTTMTRGIVLGARADAEVRSPTFLLHSIHPGPVTVHHFDLYRLPQDTDLRTLGLDEALEGGAAVVEWPERASSVWFNGWVHLTVVGDSKREVTLELPFSLGDSGRG